ncbi:MAG: pilus assembly protein [Gammaproteobacteria bacterium (ex Lamellibrachia satsuma)]|nr:MAG: pilus assembly protein [Gammaproteobacteria bacterium (ex Lamellibrachia satsuma)]RRS30778.1 MAG: pilus assembly protein [Gammaproteobacteria bacterium (ex Lamellibrachia satsuma)]RRS36805.1 MAG: pilus assembly protein [Gammaproteobacteria bacterium (ex Lamellibrachia satsuma)]
MKILHRNHLPLGGFAGLKEYQLVIDPKAFGELTGSKAFSGLGNFVYLADARFQPHGETGLHPHREVDVLSFMIEGKISHEGSLGQGQSLSAFDVQVQRAGGEGFTHNEINPDGQQNRMIQLFVLPEKAGEAADYRVSTTEAGNISRIYGGLGPNTHFTSGTIVETARLNPGQDHQIKHNYMVYIATGTGSANGQPVEEGCLLKGSDLQFIAKETAYLIIIRLAAPLD